MILQNNSIGYLGAFLGGVAVSFSPCVYPLIPITLSYIGVKSGSSRIKGLFLSLVYAFGLAITYSILGIFAALTGRIFGEIAGSPIPYLIIGNICIIAGLSFLEVFNIGFTGLRLLNKIKLREGYLAVFLVGMASGLVAGPCTAPALGVILTIVSAKQNIFYGATLLFVFSCGMTLLLVLAGTFSGIFLGLSKKTEVFALIKKISGLVLIVIGEYFIFKGGRMAW
ncbi:hypothetical protein EPO66_01505 [bacterium]|nr:MAG: hypothetical protein EPO66_01505 [bacterium]